MQWLINIIKAAVQPRGMIIMWHGSVESIPDGWHLCDGTEGTPNFLNRFVIAAGSAFDPLEIGGTDTHAHPFTGDGHSHTVVGGTDIAAGADYAALTSISVSTGDTDSRYHRPPYIALCFIMKL